MSRCTKIVAQRLCWAHSMALMGQSSCMDRLERERLILCWVMQDMISKTKWICRRYKRMLKTQKLSISSIQASHRWINLRKIWEGQVSNVQFLVKQTAGKPSEVMLGQGYLQLLVNLFYPLDNCKGKALALAQACSLTTARTLSDKKCPHFPW
jgi:hypothetical protein